MTAPELWPHQQRGYDRTCELIDRGVKNILLTSPTGGGKSRLIHELTNETHLGVAVFSVRRMLTEQLYKGFSSAGIPVGVRASGYGSWQNPQAKVQITSMQTEASRWDSDTWSLPYAHIVEVDEAHLQKAETACKVFEHYNNEGAIRIGFTATPLGISHLYDELVVAGTNSELRKTGAHLPCLVYAPSEIDTSAVERVATIGKDFTTGEIEKVWCQAIYGNVLEHYLNLNPEQKPALLMAPGVQEAVFFAKTFNNAGIPAAAVDGNEIWFRGERMKANRKNRAMANIALATGEIKIICNRFVYREAVNIPELYHLILACPIGSVLSYIQTVGRVLRNHPSLDHVIVQDHGGNWWRHGSPNEDRDWEYYWKENPTLMTRERAEKFHQSKERDDIDAPEPICCPKCHTIRSGGITCHVCGHQADRSVRTVIQRNGKLTEKTGDVFKKRRLAPERPDMVKKWIQCVHRCRNSGRTFAQARGLFAYENYGMYPSSNWEYYPKRESDLFQFVADVPRERLK